MDNSAQLYLNSIVNNLPHYLFWKNTDTRFVGCNKIFLQSTGLSSPDDLIGKTDYDMPWKSMATTYRKDDLDIIASGKPKLDYEEIQPQSDGTEKIMLVSKTPLFDKEKVIGVLCIYTDITERKRIEKEFILAKEKAEAANRAKTDFIHNMEHDIRTPFNGIVGLASILFDQEVDPHRKELISDILHCTRELLDYSNTVLDFSRIELGSLPLLAKKFDLKKLLDGLMNMEIPAAKLKALDFSLSLHPDVPCTLIGDRYRLQRVLINLLSNAIKFTKEGHVSLEVRLARQVDPRNIILQFIVKDTGIGISKEVQNTIYEKFSRVTPSSRGHYKGQGLGLPIVKRFIHEMEGDIEVESVLGEGTRFICTLPFKLPLINVIVDNT